MKVINFVLENNNNFYKLELAKTLLHFTEFDFTYFWEQCIGAGKIAYKTGTLPADKLTIARTAVSKCHPYVEACLSSSFDSITVDCIIAYICSSEHIGLEELWSRCISPKNNYEQTIFRRISEYKTGRAINRWVNIVRMNEYARSKMEFIYDDPEGGPVTPKEADVRREYFDLAFSVAANEIGYSGADMPHVRRYSPALLPGASFKIGKISKSIYHRMADALSTAAPSQLKGGVVSDQNAMDVYSYIKNLSRPEEMDMKFTREAVDALPDSTIYMPTGFKGIIDLEFDLLSEENIMLVRCRNCGKYFIKDDLYDRPYCDRVGSNGKTCREADSEFLKARAEAEAAEAARAAEAAKAAAEKEAAARAAAEAAAEAARAEAAARAEEEAAAAAARAKEKEDIYEYDDYDDYDDDYSARRYPPREDPPERRIPVETEKRSQRIYNAVYRRVGRIMDDNEFKEWSQYLSNLKRNIKNGDCDLSELDDFLDYSESLYSDKKQQAPRTRASAPRRRAPAEDIRRTAPSSDYEVREYVPASYDRPAGTRRPSAVSYPQDDDYDYRERGVRAADPAGRAAAPYNSHDPRYDEDIHVKYVHGADYEDDETEVRDTRRAPAAQSYGRAYDEDAQRSQSRYPPYRDAAANGRGETYPAYSRRADDDYIPDRGAPVLPGRVIRNAPAPSPAPAAAPVPAAVSAAPPASSAGSPADDPAPAPAPAEKTYRPFMPKKYASVYDAMMDAAISDSAGIEMGEERDPIPAPAANPRIRKPDWEYLKK